mmetsp:Transcript_4294/g.17734  ORF Transcript_4294/g.17734 Transcript_4294/m.17734 type:complete len:279 (-) Transcript_4294:296-1132(-)
MCNPRLFSSVATRPSRARALRPFQHLPRVDLRLADRAALVVAEPRRQATAVILVPALGHARRLVTLLKLRQANHALLLLAPRRPLLLAVPAHGQRVDHLRRESLRLRPDLLPERGQFLVRHRLHVHALVVVVEIARVGIHRHPRPLEHARLKHALLLGHELAREANGLVLVGARGWDRRGRGLGGVALSDAVVFDWLVVVAAAVKSVLGVLVQASDIVGVTPSGRGVEPVLKHVVGALLLLKHPRELQALVLLVVAVSDTPARFLGDGLDIERRVPVG